MKERTITKAFLKACPGKAIKIHVNQFMEVGTPDTFASIPGGPCPCCGTPVICPSCGFSVGVAMVQEFKKPGELPTPKQKSCLRAWQKAGALVGVADSKALAMALVTTEEL